jgi:catechol 2,3-dioxygenase-like lactoylglutathione lyase family enzyme
VVSRSIAAVTLLVEDYDAAISFFADALGFTLVENRPMDVGKRWGLVAPVADGGSRLLLAKASTPEQHARIGDQTGGRVALILETDDFNCDHARMLRHGVRFLEAPRHEAYGIVAVFLDLVGNRWDLLQRA